MHINEVSLREALMRSRQQTNEEGSTEPSTHQDMV